MTSQGSKKEKTSPPGRPSIPLDGELIAKLRLSSNRFTWSVIARKVLEEDGTKASPATLIKAYRNWIATNPDSQILLPSMPPDRQVLSRNLSDGFKVCKGLCHRPRPRKDFGIDRKTATGVYLHYMCKECVKDWNGPLVERINRRLLGLDKPKPEPVEVIRDPDAPKNKGGRPPTINVNKAWGLRVDKGYSWARIAKELGCTEQGVRAAVDNRGIL